MKKRMVVLLLVMIMISGLCVNAMATERASQIKPKLSFSGKTANCSVTVVEAGKLDVTLELWNGRQLERFWDELPKRFWQPCSSQRNNIYSDCAWNDW